MFFKYDTKAVNSADITVISVEDKQLLFGNKMTVTYSDADMALAAFNHVMKEIQRGKPMVSIPTIDDMQELLAKQEHEEKVKAAALDFLSGKSDPIKNKEFEVDEVLAAAMENLRHCSLSNFEEDLVKRISKTAKDAGEFLQALHDSCTPEGNKLTMVLGEYLDKFTSHKDAETKEAKKVET